MSVARETAEAEPAVAAELFGPRIALARRYVEDLIERGEQLGLIGPLELPRIWTRHVVNSALLAPLLSGRVGDVGSGAGLPGIVLAIARPDLEFVLIEPMERRTAWLEEQRAELGLDNVTVLRSRAEEAPTRSLDVVTARAVGALSKLIPLTARLAVPGGELILMKGASVDQELDKAAKAILDHHLSDVRVEVLGTGMATEPTRVFRATVN
ncbi:MAG: rRNA ((527)-N(7))-methyltransferase RsmG [Naasia sp.]|nr:rRNA ((527)-N(7))-methyltransferase RsmG [Naasia sp.]